MKSLIILASAVLVCFREYHVNAFNLPGPRVYVVTPTPRSLQIDQGRSRPFYYHNWLRRIDNDLSTQNLTTTTTASVPKVKTPDLIFAQFESDSNDSMKKSIRKLLEKEKVGPPTTTTTTTTTSRPIYVPDEDFDTDSHVVNYGLPVNMKQEDSPNDPSPVSPNDPIDYFSMYNNLYENYPSPVFLPSTTQSPTTTTTTTTTNTPEINKVQNVWHIIDSEKTNQYDGKWEEIPVETDKDISKDEDKLPVNEEDKNTEENDVDEEIDENFALPGLNINPVNEAENESRAIRTEPNIRFPYVNLKPFQLKLNKKPMNNFFDKKKGNTLLTSLDNFHDLKNPVRGEAQDVIPMRDVIDRYNPAQPYLPHTDSGSKVSKQNSVYTAPKATANLVPPPPPPPKLNADDFPVLTNYESFPPYAMPSFDSAPPPPPAPPRPQPSKPSVPMFSPPAVDISTDPDSTPDSDNLSDNDPMINGGYGYKPPPAQQFIPTIAPTSKPFNGYSYKKPPMASESPAMPSMDDKPDFHEYHYNKPEPSPPSNDHMPPSYGHHDAPPSYDHHDAPPSYGHQDAPPSYGHHDAPPSYGHHDAPPSYGHDTDYPELIFQKNHGAMDNGKGTDDMKGMVPPPAMDMKPADNGPSMDDHGFPHDFPGDFKYHHGFDDHHYFHHEHHETTTTETPRVNRYSYYYLGKKLYYLPLYFSVYFIVYVGALIIKAVLRHKIVYPNSWRPNDMTASFFSKRSVDYLSDNSNLHDVTRKVTHAISTAAEKYLSQESKNK